MKYKSFLHLCHKKDVIKMLSIYIVSSWIILQVLAVTWQALNLPQKSVTYLIILLLALFPVYILLIWKFQLASLGKKKDQEKASDEDIPIYFHKMYFSGLGMVCLLCGIAIFIIVNQSFAGVEELPQPIVSNKIAILKFGNNTGESRYDVISKMAADWISHSITENKVAQIISQDIIDQYKNAKGKNGKDDDISIVRKYLKPIKIISGNFYLENGELVFQAKVTDGKTNQDIIGFQSKSCNVKNPLKCIEDLEASITGFLITEDQKILMLQESPPKYEAYKLMLEAKNSDEGEEYLSLLNQALAEDPNYFEPKVLRVAYYYNRGKYKTADSLLAAIKPDSHGNDRQLNLLNMYQAMLSGNNNQVYHTLLKEYNMAPFDLKSNKSTMVVALQFVNRPEEVDSIYNVISMNNMDFRSCSDCIERVFVKAYADIGMKKYDVAIALLENVLDEVDSDFLKAPLIATYIRSGKDKELDDFLSKMEFKSDKSKLQVYYLKAGKEYLLAGNKQRADLFFNKTLEASEENIDRTIAAEANFRLKNYRKAKDLYTDLYREDSKNTQALTALASIEYLMGSRAQASSYIDKLKHLKNTYDFGDVNYALAQYYAIAGEKDLMYQNLFKSVGKGHLFKSGVYKNDPDFREYMKEQEFQEVMNFWH